MRNLNRFDEAEELAVIGVLRSGQLSSFYRDFKGGQQVQAFEEEFAYYHGVPYGNAISVSSGTTALHTALLACGINNPSQRVVTTPLSFVASASAIRMAGAYPYFADVDERTYNLSFGWNRSKVVSAMVAVHLLGMPCDMDSFLLSMVDTTGYIVEDCAQALGARYDGKLVGTLGDISCFSFQETKTISTGGEGGMIITSNNELADKCRMIRNHGEKYALGAELGYNYRMTEIQAAIGRVQLRKLDHFNSVQVHNARYIMQHLPKGITPPYTNEKLGSVFFLIGCLYDEKVTGMPRQLFIDECVKRGVSQLRPGRNIGSGYNQLIYDLPYFYPDRPVEKCKVAESLLPRFLWLDLHRWRELEEVKADLDTMKEILK